MIKVSVIILAYNHEKWINAAIKSVLDQSISNEIEVIIHDDCSTDQTLARALEWRDKYPDVIRVVSPKENSWSKRQFNNRIIALINEETRGTYLAMLEGDDYWGDADKLRKQTLFLDSHPEFAMCFHNVNFISADGEFLSEVVPQNSRRDYSAKELRTFQYAYLHLSSMSFRNYKLELPDEFFLSNNGDMFIPFAYGKHGGAKFQSEILPSCYRQTSQGVWAGLTQTQKNINKLQTGLLMVSCLLATGDTKFALAQISQRVIPNANAVLASLPDRDLS